MTVKMLESKHSETVVPVGCSCFFGNTPDAAYGVRMIEKNWFIELPMIYKPNGEESRFFEIAIHRFCPMCDRLEYRIIPTCSNPFEIHPNYVYVVTDKGHVVVITRNRQRAKKKYSERLLTFHNPYGKTAENEVKIDYVEFIE